MCSSVVLSQSVATAIESRRPVDWYSDGLGASLVCASDELGMPMDGADESDVWLSLTSFNDDDRLIVFLVVSVALLLFLLVLLLELTLSSTTLSSLRSFL